jgi:hypothetical protein
MDLKRLAALGVAGVVSLCAAPVAAHVTSAPVDDGVIDSGGDVHGTYHKEHGATAVQPLDAEQENVRLVGKMRINQDVAGRVSDVGTFGDHAYLGAFNERDCQKGGVYVFDISRPTAPKQVNFIRTANDSYVGEGVQVVNIDTPQYEGDVLAMNNEICGRSKIGAVGGFSLVDVSNPKSHKYLVEGFGDFAPVGTNGGAHTYHSVFMWDAGDKAYLVGVDNEESSDVDIYDISNPREPQLIAEHDLTAGAFGSFTKDPVLGHDEAFLHDMIVKRIGSRQVLLASYWDACYVQLDVTDPRNPRMVGDTNFASRDPEAAQSGLDVVPEGNAHQAEFSEENDYVVAADEDFSPYYARGLNVSEGGLFATSQGSNTPQITDDAPLEGTTVFVGRACPGDAAVPAGGAGSQIAVVARGACDFTVKVAAIEAAGGYEGIVIYNREASDACDALFGMSVEGNTPTVSVTRDVGFGFFDQSYDLASCEAATADAGAFPAAIGATGDVIKLTAGFDGWGYVHLYRNNGDSTLEELDTYAIPEAHSKDHASGYGDLSVHEVAMSEKRNGLAYFAYYAGGFRVARIEDGKLVERGAFREADGNNFWGVQLFQKNGKEYVLASDRDYGLYVFEYTGPGAPNAG